MKTREIVASKICDMFNAEFDIAKNLNDNDWARVAGLSHLCMTKKDDTKTMFCLEIVEDRSIADNCFKLKSLQNSPALPFNYLIVPKEQLEYSKGVASIMGVNTRFGTYVVSGESVEVEFEN